MSTNLRIGTGYDVHRLEKGAPLILGGVTVPSEIGLVSHSDGDALTHAVIDALFGAAGLSDIGNHFPDSDEQYRKIRSTELLKRCASEVRSLGYEIVNIDSTVILQKPKLSPYLPDIRQNLAEVLGIDVKNVNVKAKTEEKLGFTGRSEGIGAQAVCLLELSTGVKKEEGKS